MTSAIARSFAVTGLFLLIASPASVAWAQEALNACPVPFPAGGRAVLTPLADSAKHRRFGDAGIDQINIKHVRPLTDATDQAVCLQLIQLLPNLPEYNTGPRRVAFYKADGFYMVASIAADTVSQKHRSIAFYFNHDLKLIRGISSR
jgi:hypothetical protein